MIHSVPLKRLPRYPVTAGLAALAIAVTAWFWLGHDIGALTIDARWWRDGEVWRLVTSALPHGGVLHLAFNVYWLWVLGARVEERHGSLKTLAFYLVVAVASAAAEHALFRGGVGLSGIGYGLVGYLAIAYKRDEQLADAMDGQTAVLFGAWFVLCIVFTYTGTMAIANAAHGVGALAGVLIGMAVHGERLRGVWTAAVALCVALTLLGSSVLRPRINQGTPGRNRVQSELEDIVSGN